MLKTKRLNFLNLGKEINSTILVLMLVVLVNALSYSVILPLLYPYAIKYGLSKQQIGFLFAIFSFFQFIFTPVIGRLSDRFGRKPLLTLSLFGTSLSLLLFAIAPSAWVLFVARALDGVTGGNMSVAQAVISDLYPSEKRARFFGFLGGTWGVSFLVGPVLGGLLSRWGISIPFFSAAFLALLAAFLALVFLPETLKKHQTQTNPPSLSLNRLSLFLKQPFILTILMVNFLNATITNLLMMSLQVIGVDRFSLTPEHLAYLMMILGVTQIFMQTYGISWWLKRWPNKVWLLEVAFWVQSVGLFAAGFMLNLWWFVVALTIFQVGLAPIRPVIAGVLSEATHDDRQGLILGVNQSLLSLGRVIGPLLAGFALNAHLGLPLWLGSGVMFISVVVLFLAGKRFAPSLTE